MFTYTKVKYILVLLLLSSTIVFAKGHTPANPDKYPYPSETKDKKGNKINVDGAIKKPKNFKVKHVYHSPYSAKGFSLGQKATKKQSKAWNTDVRPDGKGLPKGKMSVEKGAEVYSLKCASCHGEFGEGVGRFPILSGGQETLNLKPASGGDPGPLKTFGSYMPYVAPIFWYIQTAMPLSAPKSLSNSDTYGIIGYLLQVNEIKVNDKEIEDDTIIDAKFLKAVKMPNEKGFAYNNLRVPDTKNKRCMKNCIKGKTVINRIKVDATTVEPEFGEERHYYGKIEPKAGSNNPGQAKYEASCAGCHDDGVAGAPRFGEKQDWEKIVKKDFKKVLNNAINGIGAMPPKGGAMDLKNEEMENIIKYMIENSK